MGFDGGICPVELPYDWHAHFLDAAPRVSVGDGSVATGTGPLG